MREDPTVRRQVDVLVECVPSFRELRRVSGNSSPSQVIRLLNEPEQPRFREGPIVEQIPIGLAATTTACSLPRSRVLAGACEGDFEPLVRTEPPECSGDEDEQDTADLSQECGRISDMSP